jgi:hypothetical protein
VTLIRWWWIRWPDTPLYVPRAWNNHGHVWLAIAVITCREFRECDDVRRSFVRHPLRLRENAISAGEAFRGRALPSKGTTIVSTIVRAARRRDHCLSESLPSSTHVLPQHLDLCSSCLSRFYILCPVLCPVIPPWPCSPSRLRLGSTAASCVTDSFCSSFMVIPPTPSRLCFPSGLCLAPHP